MIDTISPHALAPKLRQDAQLGTMMNADAVIALAKAGDMPKARLLYRAFRRRLVEQERAQAGRTAEQMRTAALMEAFAECGIRVEAGQ